MILDFVASAIDLEPIGVIEPVKKFCGCGAAYSTEAWAKLQLVGAQTFDADEFGKAVVCELRLCVACGSTLGVKV